MISRVRNHALELTAGVDVNVGVGVDEKPSEWRARVSMGILFYTLFSFFSIYQYI